MNAVWELDTCIVRDTRTETRWPRWSPAAERLGISSILSVRMESEGRSIGSLNLYSSQPGVFDVTDAAIASIFARHAADALESVRHVSGLRDARRTRQSIGIAQGMLMQRHGLTLDQSFEVLRRYSQDNNIKLRVLADELIRQRGIPNDSEGPFTRAFVLDGH